DLRPDLAGEATGDTKPKDGRLRPFTDRHYVWLQWIGRLRSDASLARAQAVSEVRATWVAGPGDASATARPGDPLSFPLRVVKLAEFNRRRMAPVMPMAVFLLA